MIMLGFMVMHLFMVILMFFDDAKIFSDAVVRDEYHAYDNAVIRGYKEYEIELYGNVLKKIKDGTIKY